MKNQDKAIKWYEERGIQAYDENGVVYIKHKGIDIYTSSEEINYRAGIWDEEQKDTANLQDEVKELASENEMFAEFLINAGFSNEDINHIASGNHAWVSYHWNINEANQLIENLEGEVRGLDKAIKLERERSLSRKDQCVRLSNEIDDLRTSEQMFKDNNAALHSQLSFVVEHLREIETDWDVIEKIKQGDYKYIGTVSPYEKGLQKRLTIIRNAANLENEMEDL